MFLGQKVAPDVVNNITYMIPLTIVSLLAVVVSSRNLQIFGFIWCNFFISLMAIAWLLPGYGSTLMYITQQCGQAFLGITTMALATECFPDGFRGKALGISAGVGKVGAFIGATIFAQMTSGKCSQNPNFKGALASAAFVAVLGLLITLGMTPAYTPESRAEMQRLADEGQDAEAAKALALGTSQVQVLLAEEKSAHLNADTNV